MPPRKVMAARMAAGASQGADKLHMPTLMVQFAREAGIEPNIQQWPELRDALLLGPLTPVSFRLNGRDPLLEAASRVLETAEIARRLRGQGRAA